VFLTSVALLAAIGGGAAALRAEGREIAQGLLGSSALSGPPGIFLLRLGLGRKRRIGAVLKAAEFVQAAHYAKLADISAHIRMPQPEAAWCVQFAMSQGLLPGKVLNLIDAEVGPAPPPIERPQTQEDPPGLAVSNEPVAQGYELEDASAARIRQADYAVLIKARLRCYPHKVHRRRCAHCEYEGRMGVVREVSREGTRLAGKAIRSAMGKSHLSRWMTSDLRKQKDQWEAVCPNCEGLNYFNVY
jgi:hypothetical protein